MNLLAVFLLLILCVASLIFFVRGMENFDFASLAIKLANLTLIAAGIFAVFFVVGTGIRSLLIIV